MNLSIRTSTYLGFVILVSITFVLFGFVIALFYYQSKVFETQNRKFQSYLLADELRQSSDDLTRFMRTYANTGEEKYKKYFFTVLDIRNGKVARPESYNRIYWDFYSVMKDKPRPDSSDTVPLTDLMKRLGFSEEEFAKLALAKKNSDGLVRTEEIAMSAMEGKLEEDARDLIREGESLKEFARRIMHDEKYHSDKFNIMKPIDEFYILLEERTNREVANAKEVQVLLLRIIIGCIFLLLVSFIFVFTFMRKNITKPIIEFTKEVDDLVRSKDLTRLLTKTKDNEIGALATEINEFFREVNVIFKNFKGNARSVNLLAVSLSDTIKETKESMNEVSMATDNVSMETSQLMNFTESITNKMNNSKEKISLGSSLSKNNSENSKLLLKEISLANLELKEANKELNLINNQLEETAKSTESLSERSREIQSVLSSVKDISKKTSLLALNAAIESARAGEHGKGFAVVSDEVGHLATQTQKATEKISQVITDITKEIAASVTKIKTINQTSKKLFSIIARVEKVVGSNLDTVKLTETESTKIATELSSIQQNISEVNELSSKIYQANQHLAASGEEISVSMKSKVQSLDEIKDKILALNEESKQLEVEINKFKL
ncbi:MAG: methyl-accepting chemotaxis protein [Leptospiraceae bacterium]|nr:methyl-accepting chemotaxis protein [Leptospiraceae bacterium]